MTCYLTLHVLDRKTMLPLDLDLSFGTNKSAWGQILEVAMMSHGIGIQFYQSEDDPRSLDGVRCWWTDDPKEVRKLALYLQEQGCLERTAPGDLAHWEKKPGEYRFIFELV